MDNRRDVLSAFRTSATVSHGSVYGFGSFGASGAILGASGGKDTLIAQPPFHVGRSRTPGSRASCGTCCTAWPRTAGQTSFRNLTRLQDGQGLAAVPDRLIRPHVTAFGGVAFGGADRLPGVEPARLTGLLVIPLARKARVLMRKDALHGSGSSSVKVRRVNSSSPFGNFSWVATIRATWSSSARMPASTTPSSNAFAPEMLASRSGSRRLDG